MTDPTLLTLVATVERVADELHDFRQEITDELRDLRVRVIGDGKPEESLLWQVGLLRKDTHTHQRNNTQWNWRRFVFDVSKSVATVIVLLALGWMIVGARADFVRIGP